jgi:hypothetical protein
MCGIAGIHFKNPRNRGMTKAQLETYVNELLRGIEARGKDATGIVAVNGRGPVLQKADTAAWNFTNWRRKLPRGTRTVLCHTRWATQGKPEINDNNHPVVRGSTYVTHNGHIGNDDDLFAEYGFERIAQVDTEIIPALLDHYGLDKAHLALQRLDGNAAIAAVDPVRFPNQVILAKGWTSPLIRFETPEFITWASEAWVIRAALKVALDVEVDDNDPALHSFQWGELLYIDGASTEKLTFKPYQRVVTPATTTPYSNNYYGSRPATTITPSSRTREFEKECDGCKHGAYWHGQGKSIGGGRCYGSEELPTGGKFYCRCEAFVEAKVIELRPASKKVTCDSCEMAYKMTELIEVGGYMLCKDMCGAFAVKKKEETKDNGVLYDAQLYDVIHEETIKLLARSTPHSEQFINWILFEADSEERDSNALMAAYEELDNLYYCAETLVAENLQALLDDNVVSLDDEESIAELLESYEIPTDVEILSDPDPAEFIYAGRPVGLL